MRIEKASGRAKCKDCNEIIEKDTPEVVGNLGTGKFEGHHHLFPTANCKGFIVRHWGDFVDPLVSSLSPAQLAILGLEIVNK